MNTNSHGQPVRYTLVGVVDAEVSDPGARKQRRHEVREAMWDLVDSGDYPSFDEALEAYAQGQILVPSES